MHSDATNRRLRRALAVWIVAATGEALVFFVDVNVSTYRGSGAWLTLPAQIACSFGFPVSLWLLARALDAAAPRVSARLAKAAAIVSALVWLLYDVASLRRLLPANIDIVIGLGIRASALVSLGWWGRNLEVFLTVLIFGRIAQRGGVRYASKWPFLIGSVLAAKIVSLFLPVGLGSTTLPVLQRLVAIGCGALALRNAKGGPESEATPRAERDCS